MVLISLEFFSFQICVFSNLHSLCFWQMSSGYLFQLLMMYNRSLKWPGVLFLSFLKKALLESWNFISRKRERIKITDRCSECPSFCMGKPLALLQADIHQRIIWIINFCHHILEHKGIVAVLWHVTGRTRRSMVLFPTLIQSRGILESGTYKLQGWCCGNKYNRGMVVRV